MVTYCEGLMGPKNQGAWVLIPYSPGIIEIILLCCASVSLYLKVRPTCKWPLLHPDCGSQALQVTY